MNQTNKILVILVILLSLFTLGLGGYIVYKELWKDNNDSNNSDIVGENNDDVVSVDYSGLVGQYVNVAGKSVDDIRNDVGVVLVVNSISSTGISFSIESISTGQRIAVAEKDDVDVYSIKNNVYKFIWFDSFNSYGTGSIVIADGKLSLSLNTKKIAGDNSSGWSLGSFDNLKMYKASIN